MVIRVTWGKLRAGAWGEFERGAWGALSQFGWKVDTRAASSARLCWSLCSGRVR